MSFSACRNLKNLVEGETVMVNWFPPGEQRAAKVIRFEKGKPIVELLHDHALLLIESREQVSWDEKIHPRKK